MPLNYVNSNVKLRATIEPSKSFILDELNLLDLDEYMHKGSFFNRQRLGLKVKNFEKESNINKRYQIVATLNASPFNIHY
jgi:hypothetical protein